MLRIIFFGFCACAPLLGADETVLLGTALEQKKIGLTVSGNGRDSLHFQLTAPGKVRVNIPAGAVFRSDGGECQLTLRSVVAEPGPAADVDAIVPAAALSARNTNVSRTVNFGGAADPKLNKLLELFGAQNDLPRPTAQLAIFVALEDITWPAWKKWMEPAWNAEKPPKAHPTPAEVAQAIDAIAFARLAHPEAKFAILADEDLKRLALRNPWARGKAMVLYGLTVEDAITGDSSLPVDLGKLLHTSPNDNCAICRQRNKGPVEIP